MATKSWMFSLVTSQSSGPTSQPSDGEGLMLPVKDPKELGQAQSKHHFPVRLLQLHCEFCLIFSSTRHNRKMVQVQKWNGHNLNSCKHSAKASTASATRSTRRSFTWDFWHISQLVCSAVWKQDMRSESKWHKVVQSVLILSDSKSLKHTKACSRAHIMYLVKWRHQLAHFQSFQSWNEKHKHNFLSQLSVQSKWHLIPISWQLPWGMRHYSLWAKAQLKVSICPTKPADIWNTCDIIVSWLTEIGRVKGRRSRQQLWMVIQIYLLYNVGITLIKGVTIQPFLAPSNTWIHIGPVATRDQ